MEKSIISEGKTTAEAVENGLKILKVSKSKVDIKVLENEEKKSFFNILAPRKVKVELTLKENIVKTNKNTTSNIKKESKKFNDTYVKRSFKILEEDKDIINKNLDKFLSEFIKALPTENVTYNLRFEENRVFVDINNEDLGYLIGYRGESMRALESILSVIAGKGIDNRVSVILDIEKYRAKRIESLEKFAVKVAEGVINNQKDRKLEPMLAYERKVIHSKLQEIENIETRSIGEEPNRRIIVSYKNS